MKRLALISLAWLAACGTPQDQCIARGTRELRTIDRLIAETEGNLDRGYAIETVTVYDDYWTWCDVKTRVDGDRDPPRFCRKQRAVSVERPRAIDLAAEARVLQGLQQKRAELARAAEPVIAQCRATYPK